MPDDKPVMVEAEGQQTNRPATLEAEGQQTNIFITPQEVQQNFLKAFNNFGVQLKALTDDLKALEVVTAVGTTTADIESSGSDLTNIANGQASNVSGVLNILARTRFELDGDLLVVLPTKTPAKKAQKSSSAETKPGTNIEENEPIQIDTEILNLHKENVNMAIQNLQFVYGKVMDIATKFIEGNNKGNVFSNLLRI